MIEQQEIRGVNKSSRNFITVLDFTLGVIGRGLNGMTLVTKINLSWPEMSLSFQMCSVFNFYFKTSVEDI